ncbi:MAG: LysR family transcriptional regulator [Geminicoccaceae bacterium]
MKKHLDWDGYRFLLGVVYHGGLIKASQALSVSQPTVGRKIKQLEDQLGTRIFDRKPEGYCLTEEGRRVVAGAEAMARHAKAIEQDFSGCDSRLEGCVAITLTETMAQSILLPELAAFRSEYPEIELQLQTSNKKLDLNRQESQVAIRVGDPGADTLYGNVVGQMSYGLYGAQSYLDRYGRPESVEMLAAHALIDTHGEIEHLPQARHLRELMPSASKALCCTSVLGQYQAMLAGLGLTTLPHYVVAANPGLYDHLLEKDFGGTKDVWLLTNSDVRQTKRVRAVMGFLKQVLRKNLNMPTDGPCEIALRSKLPVETASLLSEHLKSTLC